MAKKKFTVTEMFSEIMKLLEQTGYAKHTLWGNMYGSLKSVVSFYQEKGVDDYDTAITNEFLQAVEKRYREGGISRDYYNAQKRAAKKFQVFYETGTLTWECTNRKSKYQLNEEYNRLLDTFLSSRDFHENTKWDFAWAVRRYLSFFQEKGLTSLDKVTVNDARAFIIHDMKELAVSYARLRDAAYPDSPYFFPDKNGNVYSATWLQKRFKGFFESANPDVDSAMLPTVRVYDLRHRFASAILNRWLDNGENLFNRLPYLRTYMGHKDLSATVYYIHLLPENLIKSAGIDWQSLRQMMPEVELWDE